MDSGQSGMCHRACTPLQAASDQKSGNISSARMNLIQKLSLKYEPKTPRVSSASDKNCICSLAGLIGTFQQTGLISNGAFSGMNEGAFEMQSGTKKLYALVIE